ncbi:MAG: iron complex transport system substrate-binding protein [Chlamydiales bacterium]|jgi:iron complex transport system substrate-binding protein
MSITKRRSRPPLLSPWRVAVLGLSLAVGLSCGAAESSSSAAGERRAERIVPANSGAAELLLALVDPDRLAALPATVEGYGAEGLGDLGLPTFANYTAENVLAFAPDLVVTHGWQSADATQVLERGGIPVLTLPDIGDFAGLCGLVELLGESVQARAAAATLNTSLRARFDLLKHTDRSAVRLVSYTNFGSGGWTAGAETTANLLCELAGVHNMATENGYKGHQNVDFETLLTWNPDVFLVGASGENPGHSPAAVMLRKEPSLQTIEALKHGRIIVLPAELYTTNSQHVMDAAEYLARALDELFPPASD